MRKELVGVALVSGGGAVHVHRRCGAANNKPASTASRCFFWDLGGVHVCTPLTPRQLLLLRRVSPSLTDRTS